MSALFLQHSALAFFALAMTIISAWVKRSPWIWGSFLIFAFILGYFAKIVSPIALAPIGGLFILHSFLKGDVKGLARFILVLLAVALSFGLMIHKFPGFNNWLIFKNIRISSGAIPFNLWLNFDKPFIGIFILVLGFPLVASLKEFGNVLKRTIPLTIAGIIIIAIFALLTGMIRWDPKFPSLFWFFALENLIFVTIIEEAFWRGFIQNEFFRWFGGKGVFANAGCVIITALFFAASHYLWVPNIPFLSLVFVTGLVYGTIYQYTRALESSIFCHWIFNLTHFLLFTYPILRSAM